MSDSNIKLPTILDIAYLSARIYEDPEDDSFFQDNMPATRDSWISMPSMMYRERGGLAGLAIRLAEEGVSNLLPKFVEKNIGLQMGVYCNVNLKCSVLPIRGSAGPLNYLEDGMYTFNMMPALYERVIKYFCMFTSHNSMLKQFPLVACTGHSLGGILAKMIAPVTGLSTYTFNSPGVVQFLTTNSKIVEEILKSKNLTAGVVLHSAKKVLHDKITTRSTYPEQEVITYITNQDIIGNLRRDNDFGEYVHLRVGDDDENIIPDSEVGIKNRSETLVEIAAKTAADLLINSPPSPRSVFRIGSPSNSLYAEDFVRIYFYALIEHSLNWKTVKRLPELLTYHRMTKIVLKTLIKKYDKICIQPIKPGKTYGKE